MRLEFFHENAQAVIDIVHPDNGRGGHWLLGERSLRSDWFVIAIALGGIALFFCDKLTPGGLWGNAAALGSGLSFATMVLVLRRERDRSPLSVILLGNIFAAAIGLPFVFARMPSAHGWVALAVLGVVQLGLPYVLYVRAIRRVTALDAIVIPLLEPVLNPLWVMLFHGEKPGPWSLAGAALVLGAVLFRGVLMVVARRN